MIVAGGKGVFGVEADAQPVAFFGRVDDVADLLEAVAEIRSLAGGDFQRHSDLEAGAGFVHFVQRLGNRLDAFYFAGADVGAGVGDQVRHVEYFAAFHLVDERADGTLAQSRVGRAQVEQVGIVGDHRSDAGFLPIGVELRDLVFSQRLRRPLARRLGENLNRLAGDLPAFEKGVADAAGDGHMGAQITGRGVLILAS